MYQGMRVAVVVPALNEEHNLSAMLGGIPDFVDDILVVDDGSRDGTSEVALDAQRQRPGIEVIRHLVNRGVGAAVKSGYRAALLRGSDVVVVMAGDGQMDPADLPALLSPIASGQADYVKGNRFARREVWRTMPQARLFGNIVLSLLTRPASGYWHIFDSQCGFTAVARWVLEAIEVDSIYSGYGYPNDLLARLWVARVRVTDVPVRPIYGPLWRSGISLKTAIYPVLFIVMRSLFWRISTAASGRMPPQRRPPMRRDAEPSANDWIAKEAG